MASSELVPERVAGPLLRRGCRLPDSFRNESRVAPSARDSAPHEGLEEHRAPEAFLAGLDEPEPDACACVLCTVKSSAVLGPALGKELWLVSYRVFAVMFIFICTCFVWWILGVSIFQRSGTADTRLRGSVTSTWGEE